MTPRETAPDPRVLPLHSAELAIWSFDVSIADVIVCGLRRRDTVFRGWRFWRGHTSSLAFVTYLLLN